MGKVSIVRTDAGIKSSLQKALDLIGGLESYISRDDRVMLKPNLNGTEGITSIELVEALIRMLLDSGVKNIIIAESTFGDQQMTDMCFKKSGYVGLAKKYGINLINLNKSEIVEVRVRKPMVLEKLNIAREVFEVDKIINIPVMKVHYATGITLALKNLKGLLVRDEKKHFHEIGLEKAIVDLNNTIKPGLNIIDCISCMERMGPKGGDIVNLNLLIAGRDSAEVDYIGSLLMGYELDEVKHLKYYIEENKIDLSKIELVGESIEDVKYDFKKVEMENLIPDGFRIYNENACSSCMNALLLSFQFLEKDVKDNVEIYLGSMVKESGNSDAVKIAFGNCCHIDSFFDRIVKGCPPYPFILKKVLENE